MKKKDLYFGVALVVVAIVIVVGVYLNDTGYKTPDTTSNDTATETSGTQSAGSNSTTNSATTSALTLDQALKIYANKRIQFNESCVPTPSYVTFKEGTKIMLQNGSSQTKNIYLDGQAYNIKAYSFVIVTLTTSYKLPHAIMVDCGTGKNNGTIFLQQ